MKKMTDRPRIEMGNAPSQTQKLADARHDSGEYTKNDTRFEQATNRINKAFALCADSTKTNSEVASAIGVTRRQVSRLRHGSQAAWDRLA